MRLLIATPFLKNIGGTELEAVNTANFLAKTGTFHEIEIFSPAVFNAENFEPFAISPIIRFSSYPKFYQSNLFKRIENKIKRTFKLRSPLGENIYWFFKTFKGYSNVYILTTQSFHYFIPVTNNFQPSKVILKYTMFENTSITSWMQKILKKMKYNIVMSRMQKHYFNVNGIENVVVQDITIGNEAKLLKVHSKRRFTFGILCRFSKEKRIEDGIRIIKELRDSNYDVTLLIQGDGNEEYFGYLKRMIRDNDLENYIQIKKKMVPPRLTEKFYKQISYFLITSVYEGGPMTGLEAMASGIPVLSYNVGAMKERLGKYDWLIANDFQEMTQIAQKLVQLPNGHYTDISIGIKNIYQNKLSNKLKIKKLQELFLN